jgi:tetratricopeptide (TPR) repeat protein
LLSALPAKILDSDLVGAVCVLPTEEAEQVLRHLADAGLVLRLSSRPYFVVDPHRTPADQPQTADQEEPLRKWAEYYLAAATAAEQRLTPSHRSMPRTAQYISTAPAAMTGMSDVDLLDWLDHRSGELRSAVSAAHAAGWTDLTTQLADAMWPLLLRRRNTDLWLTVIGTHGLPAAQHEAARPGLSQEEAAVARRMVRRMLTTLGGGLRYVARLDDALQRYQEAFDSATADGHRRDQAQALDGIGAVHHSAGRPAQAIDPLTAALDIREVIGHSRGAALTRVRLGEVAADLGQYPQAVAHLLTARTGLLAEPDPYDAARALAILGHVHLLAGRLTEAEQHLTTALAEFDACGGSPWAARATEWLADVALERADTDAARALLAKARTLFADADRTSEVARVDQALQNLSAATTGAAQPPLSPPPTSA